MTCKGCRDLITQEEAVEKGLIPWADPNYLAYCTYYGHRLGDLSGCNRKVHKSTKTLDQFTR